MSKDRLEVVENRDGTYSIQWWLAADDDMGAVLGESTYTETDLIDTDDYEHIRATLVAAETPGVNRRSNDMGGYYWETFKAARLALRTIKSALKAAGKPWPAWALQAKAAGWRPPKGWKP